MFKYIRNKLDEKHRKYIRSYMFPYQGADSIPGCCATAVLWGFIPDHRLKKEPTRNYQRNIRLYQDELMRFINQQEARYASDNISVLIITLNSQQLATRRVLNLLNYGSTPWMARPQTPEHPSVKIFWKQLVC